MSTLTRGGTAALLAAHCAGMLDLVALPVWVGAALIGSFGLDPQQAGLLASLFLGGQVVSSVLLAPRFGRVPVRLAAVAGFALAAGAFFGVSLRPAYAVMAVLHFAGGLGAGCALSVTHGSMGRSPNPHRLFATAGFALALFGILTLGGGSALVAAQGGAALFTAIAVVMVLALLAAALGFPRLDTAGGEHAGSQPPLPREAWFGMLGMGCMALAQATMFSFAERIGADRGYASGVITGVLVAAGIINLLPGPLAGLLQHWLRAEAVVIAGPALHALAVLAITQLPVFGLYAALVPALIALTVFTHTFLFGLLARLDPTGRAVAATPAMLMVGAAIGPVLGGTVVKLAGYGALGLVVAAVGLLSAVLFAGARARQSLPLPAGEGWGEGLRP